jgi:hypothetical protein
MALLVCEDNNRFAIFGFVAGYSWASVILFRMPPPIPKGIEKGFPVLIQKSEDLLGGLGGKTLVCWGEFETGIEVLISDPVTLLDVSLADMIIGQVVEVFHPVAELGEGG